jgi:hypothetical protein
MQFKGLCLLERPRKESGGSQSPVPTNTMVVHLVDATSIGLEKHVMAMRVPIDAIDLDASRSATALAKKRTIADTEFYEWLLDNRKVDGPEAPNPEGDLIIQDAIPSNKEVPTPDDDRGWKSLHWVPDLRVICRATKLIRPAEARIKLTHGEIRSLRADGVGGRTGSGALRAAPTPLANSRTACSTSVCRALR